MKEMSLSSAGAQRQSAETARASMKISIIVPVLNEGERLRPFLEQLRERAPSAEVILVNAEYYRLLRQRGRTRQLASKIVPSPRRYEEIGPYRLTAAFFFLSALYILRVPISTIARLYERLCVIQRE